MQNRQNIINTALFYASIAGTFGGYITANAYSFVNMINMLNSIQAETGVSAFDSIMPRILDFPSYQSIAPKIIASPVNFSWKWFGISVTAAAVTSFVIGGIYGYKNAKEIDAAGEVVPSVRQQFLTFFKNANESHESDNKTHQPPRLN